MDEPPSKCSKYDTDCTSIYFSKPCRLSESFFNTPCIDLAKNLLGTILVRQLSNGILLKGKIVETECYPGGDDKASYSYNGRKTPKNEPMFMEPGTLFVYQTYGMYYCMNISSQGEGSAVLLRAVEPIDGLEQMSENRSSYHVKRKSKFGSTEMKSSASKKSFKPHELCNGPSKLCISFDINKDNCNKHNLISFPDMWLEKRAEELDESSIIISSRIGIDSVGAEWAGKLLRFYLYDSKSVSVRDKKREAIRNSIEK